MAFGSRTAHMRPLHTARDASSKATSRFSHIFPAPTPIIIQAKTIRQSSTMVCRTKLGLRRARTPHLAAVPSPAQTATMSTRLSSNDGVVAEANPAPVSVDDLYEATWKSPGCSTAATLPAARGEAAQSRKTSHAGPSRVLSPLTASPSSRRQRAPAFGPAPP